jgi:hypothetical protein
MAITFVGSATGTAINGLDVTVDLTSIAMQEHDVAVLVCIGTSFIEGIGSEPEASGWTVDASDALTALVAYKRMGASPDSSVTVVGSGSALQAAAVVVEVFRGVDAITALDAAITQADGTSTTPDSPAVNTVTDGAIVISAVGSRVSDTSVTAPSGYNNKVSINAADTVSATAGMAWLGQPSAGTEDPPSWTAFSTAAWQSFSVALRPQAESGPINGIGAATGQSTASGAFRTTADGLGTGAAQSTAAAGATSTAASVGAATGQSTAVATATGSGAGAGVANGQATAAAVGGFIGGATGEMAGESTAAAIGAWIYAALGISAGAATSAASGTMVLSGAGVAAGAARMDGRTDIPNEGAGVAAGASTAAAVLAVRRPKAKTISTRIHAGITRGARQTHTGLINESL